ncbi:hypothetical protein [Kiloniella sp.]|uniref:hypothetical protein n=1 Tax=Kiloniella sp. TaxID=1938587 RepID=UPI003B0133A8
MTLSIIIWLYAFGIVQALARIKREDTVRGEETGPLAKVFLAMMWPIFTPAAFAIAFVGSIL